MTQEPELFDMEIQTSDAPIPVGPYSQARLSGSLLFISGQLGIDPKSGAMLETAEEQMRQILDNILAIVSAAGARPTDILKMTVLVTDLSEFKELNGIYGSYFARPYPARTTYEVAALPLRAKVEIDAIVTI